MINIHNYLINQLVILYQSIRYLVQNCRTTDSQESRPTVKTWLPYVQGHISGKTSF